MTQVRYDYIVVGAGFSGAVCARELAERGKKVLVVEKRKHIGGNMYDYYDKNGLLIHQYGPHIIMTDSMDVVNYIKKFDDITNIVVKMQVSVDSKKVPLPINLNSISKLYGHKKSNIIIKGLIDVYGKNVDVNIIDLLNDNNQILNQFAKDIFAKVYVGYNVKMWDLNPNEIDKNIVGRAPIRISYNDVRSKCKYNFVPANGYTNLFEKILSHHNITLKLNCNAANKIRIDDSNIFYENKSFYGKLIYTGPIDELFGYCYGHLPYRAVFFKKTYCEKNNLFSALAVTYPTKYKKFRTSDMSRITKTYSNNKVALISEYSGEYDINSKKYNIPSYPVINEKNKLLLNKYIDRLKNVQNFNYLGRLAEYKYYDMSESIIRAMRLIDSLEGKNDKHI